MLHLCYVDITQEELNLLDKIQYFISLNVIVFISVTIQPKI